MRAKSNLAAPKPTFADGPSSFLSTLSAKPKIRADSQLKSNSAAEIQRVKSELSNQIQAIMNKQEMSGRQLDSRFNQLQQDLKPKVTNLEKQQNSTQKQLDDVRQRIQKIMTDELSPLQNQYDQLGVKFERFIRYDVESKLKPMQDDLRSSREKADELLTTANSSIKKLNESAHDLQDKINKASLDMQAQQSNNTINIDDLHPKVSALEQQLRQLQDMIGESPEEANLDVVEKSVSKVNASINRIEAEILPKLLEDSNTEFVDAIRKLGEYCETKIAELQNDLSVIKESNAAIDVQRKEAEESLNILNKSSYEIQSKISNLDQNMRSRLVALQQNMNSSFSNLQSQITDFQAEGNTGFNRIKDQATDDMESLKNQISKTVREMKEGIKSNSTDNQMAQQEAMRKICNLKTQIEDNMIGRLQKVEENILQCIDTVNEVNEKRSNRYSKYGSQSDIIKRIAEVENRLALAEKRLSSIDKKSPIEPSDVTPKVEKIKPVPPELNRAESPSEFTDQTRLFKRFHENNANGNNNDTNGDNTNNDNTDNNNANSNNTDDGNANGNNTDGGNANSNNTDDGNANGNNTDGGNANSNNTDDGNANGNNTDGGNANSNNTDGGNDGDGKAQKWLSSNFNNLNTKK